MRRCRSALESLVQRPAGLEALVRQKTRFEAKALAPLLTESARALLDKDAGLALKVISAFKLTALEPALARLLETPDAGPAKTAGAPAGETTERRAACDAPRWRS